MAIVPKAIQWQDNFEGAMQRARTQGKPIMIDFYADWCGPCKMMEQSVYPDRDVIAQSQNWVTVKVNGEKRPDVMQAYGISGYPTLLVRPAQRQTGRFDNRLHGCVSARADHARRSGQMEHDTQQRDENAVSALFWAVLLAQRQFPAQARSLNIYAHGIGQVFAL